MTHEPEFSKPPASRDQLTRELAACYARVLLGSEDGKRVLADLRAKFGLQRLVFTARPDGRYDTISAALIEGERRVMHEIESALKIGAPMQKETAASS